jgi:hypothetical protein
VEVAESDVPHDSGEKKSTLRLWNRAAEFAGSIDPILDHSFHILKSLNASATIRGTSWQFRDLRDESLVFGAPVQDDLVFRHSSPSASLYRTITANLFDVIRLRRRAARLQIENLGNPRLAEDVMIPAYSFRKAQSS